VRYVGGSLDGTSRTTHDDQVSATVCTSGWDRYEIIDRVYDDGLLVEVTYQHTGEA
jgi:hypothetical protein